ncbi:Acyl-CoA desaturase 3 [Eumeta japonica]|uniref:Acyl-CoA desaturase 3 n=1 Tax=Eumeta variegata TaxID=151549 RepID=A0A4C1TNB0_EUMVA|nr:Acyl-CoA desaturase 3 [Eumeta japonica]
MAADILNKMDANGKTEVTNVLPKDIGTDYSFKRQIVWKNAIGFLIFHLMGLWGLCLMVSQLIRKSVSRLVCTICASEGVTIGAHRLYSHKAFKARPLLRAVLIFLQTMAGQNCMYIWVRDHRLHHRYSDTDADPHNAKRGFFFCHIGWLMSKKHPYVKLMGKNIDMSDLEADWMVMFQKRFYKTLYVICAILLPVWVPVHFFGESWLHSFLVAYVCRTVLQLNGTWLVNSAAHIYGTRPYDKNLQPVESWFVSMISLGEGWHNYHHAFPWDYKAAELPTLFNQTAHIIKFFERIGLAYDLKVVPQDMIKNRIHMTGDGTHYEYGNDEARSSVEARGPLHPLNPTYNTTFKAPQPVLKKEGLPLYHETDLVKETKIRHRPIGLAH